MDNEKRHSPWYKRWLHKYRLSLVDDSNLSEVFHLRLNGLGAFSTLAALFLLTIALLALLIVYTPIRNILPGYSESIRQQLVEQTVMVDSLSTEMQLQRQYLDIIKQVTTGEIQSDTVQSLDSLQMIQRERLLMAKSEATAEFMAMYEDRGHDYLQMFDAPSQIPTVSFFRPAHGVIEQHQQADRGEYGVTLRTAPNENVTAVLAGTVVYQQHELGNTLTIMVQHEQYLSVYRHVGRVLKHVGASVQSGETIALMSSNNLLGFELWHQGTSVNPEDVIAF